jgi:hypothetical protein
MSSGSYTAKIRTRGCDNTGVTEQVAKEMFRNMGGTTLAIVELEHVRQINESSGDHKVELTLGFIEPVAPGSKTEDVVRELSRALYRDRRGQDGELPGTEGAGERSTDDVTAAAEAALERDEDGTVTGTWSGDVEDAGAPGPGADDESFDQPPGTHAFMAGTSDPAKCAVFACGKTARAKVHTLVQA